MDEIRNNKGSKCSSAGKLDIIKRLNAIVRANPYVEQSNAPDYDYADISRTGLCVVLEILLRYYNEHPNNHVWFFDVEKTLGNKLVSI